MNLYKVKLKHENDNVSTVYVACDRVADIEHLIQERVRDEFTIKGIDEVCDESNFFFKKDDE